MSRITLISAVLIGLLLNKASLAEEFPVVPSFIRSVSKARLLGRETVQRDLELTDEQIQAVRKVEQAQKPVKAEDLEKRLAAYSKDGLTASQSARLEEIYVQTRGAESLFDSTIATKLGLSDDQKAKLVVAGKGYLDEVDAWFKLLQDRRTRDREETKAWSKAINEQRQAIMEQFDDGAMSILTSEQRDQLKKLRGKPIDFSGEKNTGGGAGAGSLKRILNRGP